jgi:hypothetical protein
LTFSGCTLLSAKRIVADASTAPSKTIFRMSSSSRFWPHSPHLLGPQHGSHLRTTLNRAARPVRAFLCNTPHRKSATVTTIPNSSFPSSRESAQNNFKALRQSRLHSLLLDYGRERFPLTEGTGPRCHSFFQSFLISGGDVPLQMARPEPKL